MPISGIWKKSFMAITGLFLCTFLVVHMLGNMQLLANDGGMMFNIYAYKMTHNPLIKIVSYVTYAGFLFHTIDGIYLAFQNNKSRPVAYSYSKPGSGSTWASRNMISLGLLIFFFLVVHLSQFWYKYKFTTLPTISYEGEQIKDLYKVVFAAFTEWWIVVLYLLSLVALYFHLAHGFQSAFQTLSFRHPRYFKMIKAFGIGFSILIPLGFALQPIIVFIRANQLL